LWTDPAEDVSTSILQARFDCAGASVLPTQAGIVGLQLIIFGSRKSMIKLL
jgi:hypothetical protein